MSLLTNSDKLNILNQHIKSLDFQIYNTEVDLLLANAESPVNAENVSSLTLRISALNSKRAILENEAEPLQASIDTTEE